MDARHTFTEPFGLIDDDEVWSEQDDPAQPVWDFVLDVWGTPLESRHGM